MNTFGWLDNDALLRDTVLAELDGNARTLFTQISALEHGCTLLRFLHERMRILMTADGISGHVAAPVELVENDLKALAQLGVVRVIDAVGVTLFGLTENPELREIVDRLCAWQLRWEERLRRIRRVVKSAGANGLPFIKMDKHAN